MGVASHPRFGLLGTVKPLVMRESRRRGLVAALLFSQGRPSRRTACPCEAGQGLQRDWQGSAGGTWVDEVGSKVPDVACRRSAQTAQPPSDFRVVDAKAAAEGPDIAARDFE